MFLVAGTAFSAVPGQPLREPTGSAANPALVADAHPICAHGLADFFGVRASPLKEGEPTTISGVELVPIFTKHVHQWDALVVYLPAYQALPSSDILMRFGDEAAAA